MALISFIKESEIDRYEGLVEVKELSSIEDISTLIETFEDAREKISFEKISRVVEDDEKYYYFAVSERKGSFDLYGFINEKNTLGIKVSCLNAKALFPLSMSRGVYDSPSEEVSTEEQDCDEDTPTDFLDENEDSVKNLMVLHDIKSGAYIDIPEDGLIIGRSSKSVDYKISGNTNVGRTHCRLYYGKNGYLMVHDYNSLNGTFVNNRRVHSSKDVPIHDKDCLSLANAEFEIVSK